MKSDNQNKRSWTVIQWNQTYGGKDADKAQALLQTADKGFILAGSSLSFRKNRNWDMWLVKTDVNGTLLWNKTYGRGRHDTANALIQTSDGGFALAGTTNSSLWYGGDMWLVKTDVNGEEQWNKTYGRKGYDSADALVQTADGGFVLAGTTESFDFYSNDLWLVKTDINGTEVWNKTYGGESEESTNALVQTADGGLAIAGTSRSYGYYYDMWLVKTDANGSLLWNKTYGGKELDRASALVETTDGGLALAGTTNSYALQYSDMWLVKTDANGVIQWTISYGGDETDVVYTIIQTADGNFALAGVTMSFGAGDQDMWLVKTGTNTSPDGKETPGLEFIHVLIVVVVLTSWYKRKRN